MIFPDDGMDDEDEFGDLPLDEAGDESIVDSDEEAERFGPPSDPILDGALYLAQEAGDEEAAAAFLKMLDDRRERWFAAGCPQ